MPRKFINRNRKMKSKGKRFNKRNGKRRGYGLTTSVQRFALSDRTVCFIRVSEAFTDIPLTAIDAYTWIGNGLFDPLGTSGNVQPSWFNPWMAMYAKYRVLGSRLNLVITNVGTGSPFEVVVYPTVSSTTSTNVVVAKTQPYATSKMISWSTGQSSGALRNFMLSSKMFGRNIMGDENFSGDFGSNPNNKWYWQFIGQTLDGTNIQISFVLTISFKVIFYGRLPQDESTPMLLKMLKPTTKQDDTLAVELKSDT